MAGFPLRISQVLRWLRLALAPLLLGGLAACAEPFHADVSRFQSQLPPPAGQSFFILPADPRMAGSIEFGQYSRYVAAQMLRLGYTEVGAPQQASLIVKFGYGIDRGRVHVRSYGIGADPFWGPWHGYAGFGGYYGGFHRGIYGGFGGGWGYGWYDPFFDGGVDSYTVYTSGVSLRIEDPTGRHLFEGRAEAASTSNRLPYLVPNLVEAMFTGFPGNSGSVVRITVAPEKK